ncbi:Peroxidase 57 [Linum grandiflorum]
MAVANLLFLLKLLVALSATEASLELHFYRNSCPKAEAIVKSAMKRHFDKDPSVPAGLLRLHFHDCFIRVSTSEVCCDGSVLIDSRGGNRAEKEAPPNLTLRGFEVIDDIKAKLERQCPGIVSCADVLALATRDGVALSGGSAYGLPTGRRDGTVSDVKEVHIPGPSVSISDALTALVPLNLGLDDLTTLLGAHSIGFCHCAFFTGRLYNFRGSGRPDPNMDQALVATLRAKCPRPADPKVFMNPTSESPFRLDSSFYGKVMNQESVLHLDQQLAFTDITRKTASLYASRPKVFRKRFAKAMVKLGSIGVLTGSAGEIRRNCRRVN